MKQAYLGVTIVAFLATQAPGGACEEPARLLDAFAVILNMEWQNVRMESVREKWPEPLTYLADDTVIGSRSCSDEGSRCCTSFGFGVLEDIGLPLKSKPLDVVRVTVDFRDQATARKYADAILEIATKGWQETSESMSRSDRSVRYIAKNIGGTHLLRGVSVNVEKDRKEWGVVARVSELMRDSSSR